MDDKKLTQLLADVKSDQITIDDAVEKLRHLPFEDMGFARIDHHRHIRCGFPEVIYCPGKTTEHIVKIFLLLAKKGNNVIASRADREVYDAIAAQLDHPGLRYEELARMVILDQCDMPPTEHYIAVVTAGTADLPVATEAKLTAETMGQRTEFVCDVGVAGIHRLIGHSRTMEILREASVVIVVAGMEGALASVVGGLVNSPVIGVPTSVGYGANFQGLSALLTMLNSCASGITVVNIDNGFGAGYAASMINARLEKQR
ncbi:phosphoribosylaminoimidazole carboxylase, catalytic subunit [Anaerohalosphaera lusitana]|uniref:Phosphoribosylaminoimidazole carboxylase, catalytic subunit n=1 Tax=Anaerohalosphaera lusitana TaxID=1936003 RepID=A0A1U9NQS1_9BACT|nr:nickel pincer cofactor biosynthesis protein LarB [Anaerohalosphaera lusitana]AQT70165.1 phosphoribosylaminoimidazole carboxylase, catalytic subunit [Anaerohalosphaera lusitana]